MSIGKIKQRPLRLGPDQKRSVRTQFGALCWRRHKDEVQVLLVTSRRTKRWVVPKGWPMDGATPAEAAATEAFEEAGVTGRVDDVCLGIYSYSKVMEDGESLPVVVAIFPIKVREEVRDWPEAKQRKRRWFSLKKAASLVDEPEMKRLISNFDPKTLPR